MKIALIAVALLLMIATVLPLMRFGQWWVRACDFPRAQITVAGVVVLALYLYFWEPHHVYESVILGLLVLTVGYQVAKMIPFSMLTSRQVVAAEGSSADSSVSLLIANVLMDNRKSEAFLDLVRKYDPDMILTVETDEWWEKALRPLEENYPYTLKKPLDNAFGMLVHSRLEMIDPEVRFIFKDAIPSMHMQVVLPSEDRIFMHFLHPNPPNPKYSTETTERDAELLVVGREVKERDKPTIVSGDFNDVAWSYTTTLFQKASGLLDPRIGRGMYNTYNAKNPLMRWPLDHVFHSDHFKLVRMERGPAWGSDHFPVFIELSLEAGAEAAQDEPDSDLGEERQVDGMIEEGKQKKDE